MCLCCWPCQSAPLLKHTGIANPPSHGGVYYVQIFEIAFQYTLKTSQQEIPLPDSCRNIWKGACFVLISAMTETLLHTALYVKPPSQAKPQGKMVPVVCVPAPLPTELGVFLNQNEWAFNDKGCFLQCHIRVYLSSQHPIKHRLRSL